jgi:hypothetical protein
MTSPVSRVIYDSKALIPAPFVTLSRSTARTEDGKGIGHTLTATLTGQLVSCKGWNFTGATPELYTGSGYPSDDGDCCKFANILDMQMVVRSVFQTSSEYKWFEIQSLEGGPHAPKKWLARVNDVTFQDGNWVEQAKYTVTLELLQSSEEYGGEDEAKLMAHVQHSEKWDVTYDPDNGCSYTLTHTISCSAKEWAPDDSGTKVDGWKLASDWVKDRLSDLAGEPVPKIDDEIVYSIGFLLTDHTPYNYQKNEGADQLAGTYNATETWRLAKDPVLHIFNVEYNKPRDGDFTVKVAGQFKYFLNADNDNTTDAIDAFNAWETANGPYNEANSVYDGAKTLNQCPVSRVVTRTHHKRGDGTEVFCSEQTHIVDFTFEFSDGGSGLCDKDITVVEKIAFTPVGIVCPMRTITVDGMIQGHKCKGNEDQLSNATTCFSAVNPLTLAQAAYTGGRTLLLLSQSVNKNERKGTINFSYEYSDEYTDGIKRSETITESWSCEQRNSNGEPLVTHQAEGALEAVCDINFSDLTDAIPTPESFNIDCGILTRKSISKDEAHKKISYSYTFEEECDIARIDIDKTTKTGPDKCVLTFITVSVQIVGVGCTDTIASNNAETAYNNLDTSGFAPAEYCRTSHTKTVGNHGKISVSYEYSSAGSAETNITKTESYDANDCGVKKTNIQGEIKGCCGAVGGAFAAAQSAYNALDFSALADGYIVSRSKTENQSDGKINFALEYQDQDKNYVEDQSISVRCDIDQSFTVVTIEGNITPLCITDKTAQIAAGEAGWTTVSAGLAAIASGLCGTPGSSPCLSGTATLKRSTVTKNKTNGKISYQNEYVCLKCQRMTGTIEESVDIKFNRAADVVAIVPIMGRACGPLIQNKNTKTAITFGIDVVFRFTPNPCSMSKPSGIDTVVENILSSIQSTVYCQGGCSVRNVYTQGDNEGWSPYTGRYTRSVNKIVECC